MRPFRCRTGVVGVGGRIISWAMLLAVVAAAPGAAQPIGASAEQLQPGIYQVVPDGQGVRVERSSGGYVDLGKQLSATLGEVTIWSLANANDHYRVFMQRVPAFDTSGHTAICVAGVCDVISSRTEPDASGNIELIADISGEASVQHVATALDVTPLRRQHPGHQLLVKWTDTQESHAVGEPVVLQLEITNVGTTTVRFYEGGQQRGSRDNQFRFIAFSQHGSGPAVPDTGDPTHFGGLAALRQLEPGKTFSKQVDIGKWFGFKEPGYYEITGLYELGLFGPHDDHRVIWDDFAVGRCLVHIVGASEKMPAK
jgi:hypothetical protein